MSEYKHQVNVKLGDATYESLNNIAEFEDIKPGELIRDWIREKIVQYRQKDRLYLRFLEKKEKREKSVVDLSKGHKRKKEDGDTE